MEIVPIVILVSAVAAAVGYSMRTMVVPTTRSSEPQVFNLEISEAYQRISELVSKGEVGAHQWTITDSIVNQYIIAKLRFSHKLETLQTAAVTGVVNFDFKSEGENKTMVRWFSTWEIMSDKSTARKVEKLTDSWIFTALTAPEQNLAIVTKTSRFDSKADPDRTFDRLIQRLSSNQDATTKWSIEESEKPSKILGTLAHIDLHRRSAICSAVVEFALDAENTGTKVVCTYSFDPKFSLEKIEVFRQLTDEWMTLVLWTAS
jgi:hypothetical protein